jgi:predicted DNA-binding protein (MmcQ/YjbR family)
MNKRLWNTIFIDDRIKDSLIKEWIDQSYKLVVKNLPKKDQNNLI